LEVLKTDKMQKLTIRRARHSTVTSVARCLGTSYLIRRRVGLWCPV